MGIFGHRPPISKSGFLYSSWQPEIEGKMCIARAAAGFSDCGAICCCGEFLKMRRLALQHERACATFAFDFENQRELDGHARMQRGIERGATATQTGKANAADPITERQLAAIHA